MIETIKNEFYDHNGVKSQIHTRKISETLPNTGNNNTLLNNPWVKDSIIGKLENILNVRKMKKYTIVCKKELKSCFLGNS